MPEAVRPSACSTTGAKYDSDLHASHDAVGDQAEMLVGEPVTVAAQLPGQRPLAEPRATRGGIPVDGTGIAQQSRARAAAVAVPGHLASPAQMRGGNGAHRGGSRTIMGASPITARSSLARRSVEALLNPETESRRSYRSVNAQVQADGLKAMLGSIHVSGLTSDPYPIGSDVASVPTL